MLLQANSMAFHRLLDEFCCIDDAHPIRKYFENDKITGVDDFIQLSDEYLFGMKHIVMTKDTSGATIFEEELIPYGCRNSTVWLKCFLISLVIEKNDYLLPDELNGIEQSKFRFFIASHYEMPNLDLPMHLKKTIE